MSINLTLFIFIYFLLLYTAMHLEGWISRQQEYLADIYSIKITGKGIEFIHFFEYLNRCFYQKIALSLRLIFYVRPKSHPSPKKRIIIMKQAQSIYDHFYKSIDQKY